MTRILLFSIVLLQFTGCRTNNTSSTANISYPQNEIVRVQENSESAMAKPYVILVSIDGFRYDYAAKYNAKNLLAFDASATKMIASFPTKTFPNHYTIVTGLYPGNNGLVSNSFYNPDLRETYSIGNRNAVENGKYYKGKPLWVLASENEMVSASMFWVGSEAPIENTHPTYYFKYNGKVTDQERVNQTIKWLKMPEKTRPHFITLYFSITDDVGHKHGPNSLEMDSAVKSIDAIIGNLMAQLDALNLPVNIIVVSDHGMVEVDRENVIYPEDFIPEETIVSKSFPLMVYNQDSLFIDSLYHALSADTSMYSVYLKSNMPERFHYNKEDNRVGDLLLMPKPPYTFGKHSKPIHVGSSTHGYDPVDCPEMGAIFYANGPAFIHDSKVDSFENVDIYPLVSNILGIDSEVNDIDGSLNSLKSILK
jgi:predicted AlkP superfamily pyrophosphatase or phosphodiesterase